MLNFVLFSNLFLHFFVLFLFSGLNEGLSVTTLEAAGVIVGALRSKVPVAGEESHSMAMVKLARKYREQGVVGFDICGDEGNFPLSLHDEALQYATREGLKLAVHAGEWPLTNYDEAGGSLGNIRLLLERGGRRIGHGIVLKEDEELLRQVAERGVAVECCITGNVGGRVKSYAVHPIREMLAAGVRVTLNSDNMTLSGEYTRVANPTNEVFVALAEVGLTLKQVKAILLNGAAAGFGMTPALLERFKLQLDVACAPFELQE